MGIASEPTSRRTILGALVSASAVAFALPHSAHGSTITEPIEQLNAALLDIMKMGKLAAFQQRFDHLAPRVVDAFDLDLILQGAVGASWASLPAIQQGALKVEFQRYSVATYVVSFNEFDGEHFELSPPNGADTTVNVKIVPGPSGGEIHTLGYVMRQSGDKWKAVDVMADGFISQGAVQTAEVRAVLALSGAEGLLRRLQQKVGELSSGALQ